MTTSDAVIYLAEARTCVQNGNYRSHQSLKKPFLDLAGFKDETLAGGASIQHASAALIIPLVGDIVTTRRISPGHAQIVNSPTISNPYKDELVNYLCITFTKELAESVSEFDLGNNRLQQLTTRNHFFMGKYDGRRDDSYKLSAEAAGVFVFVIEGAFEVQNRLLHPRDGLALWNVTEIEFEALSNEAMLSIIETSGV